MTPLVTNQLQGRCAEDAAITHAVLNQMKAVFIWRISPSSTLSISLLNRVTFVESDQILPRLSGCKCECRIPAALSEWRVPDPSCASRHSHSLTSELILNEYTACQNSKRQWDDGHAQCLARVRGWGRGQQSTQLGGRTAAKVWRAPHSSVYTSFQPYAYRLCSLILSASLNNT